MFFLENVLPEPTTRDFYDHSMSIGCFTTATWQPHTRSRGKRQILLPFPVQSPTFRALEQSLGRIHFLVYLVGR